MEIWQATEIREISELVVNQGINTPISKKWADKYRNDI